MTSNFDSRNGSRQLPPIDLPEPIDQGISPPCDVMDNLKRDRFELLSAYLDGEVTAEERRQVEYWLATDPKAQCLHTRLLNLRQGMQTLPIPVPQRSASQTTNQVFRKINNRRQRTVMAWGGTAIAALFVGFFSNLSPAPQGVVNQYAAESPAPADVSSDALMIALDQPLIEIPKAPVSDSISTGEPAAYDSAGDMP